MTEYINKIFNENCIEGLKKLPDNSVDCCVTSPPYYGLRDYGTEEQIGLEETPEKFVEKLTQVFQEIKRVLKPEGTLWLNLGDSYNGNKRGNTETNKNPKAVTNNFEKKLWSGAKVKDLIGIPWMVAFALRKDGWYLRQDIIWHKPNPMPESVTDRCTKSHEYIFLLSKESKYYYDAKSIKTQAKDPEDNIRRLNQQTWDNKNTPDQLRNGIRPRKSGNLERKTGEERGCPEDSTSNVCGSVPWEGTMANKKSVWTVTTKPFKEAHFATFPEDLIVDCIKAGCPEFVCNKCGKARRHIIERVPSIAKDCPKGQVAHQARGGTGIHTGTVGKSGGSRIDGYSINNGLTDCGCNEGFSAGIVIDPFMGAGTTALVARKLNRNYIGFELNKDYIKIAENRIQNEIGLFL